MYYCPDQAYKAFILGIPWETSTWVLFGSSSHFAPQKYFCGIKWDFDNLSWELDAAQIFFSPAIDISSEDGRGPNHETQHQRFWEHS